MFFIPINDLYNEKGLTLLEVLATLVLLSLLTVSSMSIFNPTFNWIIKSGHRTAANCYAASVLEDLRVNRDKITIVSNVAVSQLGFRQEYKAREMNAEISMFARDEIEDLFDVIVTVTWVEGSKECSLHLNTILRAE